MRDAADARVLVRRAFAASYPNCRIGDLRHRGRENGNVFIAVIYFEPHWTERPNPYKLFMVADGAASEVTIEHHPRFALLGRK